MTVVTECHLREQYVLKFSTGRQFTTVVNAVYTELVTTNEAAYTELLIYWPAGKIVP